MKTTHIITALVLFLVVFANAQNTVIGNYCGVVHYDSITREVSLTLQSDSTFLLCVDGDSICPYTWTSHGNWRSEGGWIYFDLNDEFVLYNTRGRDEKGRQERMDYDLYSHSLKITKSDHQPDRIFFRLESYCPDFVTGEHFLEKQ